VANLKFSFVVAICKSLQVNTIYMIYCQQSLKLQQSGNISEICSGYHLELWLALR